MKLHNSDQFICLALFISVVAVYLLAPVRMEYDSKYSMLLSQHLISKRNFVLNDYNLKLTRRSISTDELMKWDPYGLEIVNGNIFYWFPPGTSVLSIPFVAIMNCMGISVVDHNNAYSESAELIVKKYLSSILMAGMICIIYFTARYYLSIASSLFVALVAAFGTSIFSTASRGLWAHDWGIFLLGIVIYKIVKLVKGNVVSPVMLGTLLSWMYFVRPTYVISIIAITVFIAVYYRKLLYKLVLTGAVWLLLFVVYSEYNFGHLLPSYYQGSRLGSRYYSEHYFGNALPSYYEGSIFSSNYFVSGFMGGLISPSRGLFVFSPFILVTLFVIIRYFKTVADKRMVYLAAGITAFHSIMISTHPVWFGGGCYGPRLMTDIIPWIILLTIIAVDNMVLYCNKRRFAVKQLLLTHPILISLTFISVVWSVFVHSRGAISWDTIKWHDEPERGKNLFWDWQRPQFLAGLVQFKSPIYSYNTGDIINFSKHNNSSEIYQDDGWALPENDFTWAINDKSNLKLNSVMAEHDIRMSLDLIPFIYQEKMPYQRLEIQVNGVKIKNLFLTKPEKILINVPVNIWSRQKDVEIVFLHPDAQAPKALGLNNDDRRLSIAFKRIRIF